MRPLAAGAAILMATSAPTAYWLLKRHDLNRQAAIYARQIAGLVRQTAEERGNLWRYDTPKLLQALRFAQGEAGESDIRLVEVVDLEGNPLVPPELLWPVRPRSSTMGEASLQVNGAVQGTVRVWVKDSSAWRGAGVLALIFGLLGLGFGLALYLWPQRLFREEDLVRAFIGRALRATEEERLRVSRELHDGVGQAVGAAAVALARARAQVGEPGTGEALRDSSALLDAALDEVRRVARGLRPPALEDLGLGPAVVAFSRQLAADSGLGLELEVGELPRLPAEFELACYRLVQEALHNVVRHAQAAKVRVGLGRSPTGIWLRVQDDGQGFVAADRMGLGLLGARERIGKLLGSFTLETAPGKGTLFAAALPFPEAVAR
jgi:signal transduction histidine kinase